MHNTADRPIAVIMDFGTGRPTLAPWPSAKKVNQTNLQAMDRNVPDLVATDLIMPGMNGLEVVEAVKLRHPHVPVILMTAFGSAGIAKRALQEGAASYVPKKKLREELRKCAKEVG